MKPFTVVSRTEINDSNFVSSTVTEDDYDEWSDASVSYTTGDRVIVIADHKVYQAKTDHTSDSGNGPDPNGNTDQWLVVGATNRWKMFDDVGNTSTIGGSTLTFVVTGDFVNSMGFLGLSASTVRIQASYDSSDYYDETFTMEDYAIVTDWYEYFTVQPELQSQLIVFDIPSINGSTYTITLTGVSSTALGTFVMGSARPFGFTEYTPKVGIISYTEKTEDEFGNVSVVRRPNRRTMDVSVVVERDAFDLVNRALVSLDGVLALWVADGNDTEALTLYGYFRDFEQDLAYPTITYATLQIESII